MQYGTVCPEGFLPAYSVDTEAEAISLMAMLPLALDGKKYAEELFDFEGKTLEGSRRVDAFVRFGKRLEKIHKQIQERKINGKNSKAKSKS